MFIPVSLLIRYLFRVIEQATILEWMFNQVESHYVSKLSKGRYCNILETVNGNNLKFSGNYEINQRHSVHPGAKRGICNSLERAKSIESKFFVDGN